ncbi:DUF6238 family protein [Streptomyces sp. NBC_00304]|uniref:DUF6238 family protein n=1 Tax=Streptomyces sp. NBC_00304 TaxID=2975706 RepID=UPI002E2D3DA1|nr:DUF6238 family protein [Streptomyces sp. NBC_00304]
MTPRTPPDDAHPYLRAASAGIRHHTRSLARPDAAPPSPVDRAHLDVLHAHLTALHQLLAQLAETTRPPHPAAGRHLTTAHTRLWQATTEIHSAFHLLPSNPAEESAKASECHPERLPEGPPVLTICQRHLATGHVIRRTTTPTDLRAHTTACVR